MEMRAKIGQLVRLRAGGPVLCITHEYPMEDGSYSYCCEWFAHQKLKHSTFPIVALEPVEGEFEAEFEADIEVQVGTEEELEAEADAESDADSGTKERKRGKNYH